MVQASNKRSTRDIEPGSAEGLWRLYSTEEDRDRTNAHYEQPVQFFNTITGGKWNVYSCSIWENAATITQSQERKLDRLAEMMNLKPGQRVLDVGCGWGGPLVYLSQKYGVTGVGLTLSDLQKGYADQRIAQYGAPVEVRVCHWRDFQDAAGFDAVYTDEVIAHFTDLLGYFTKVRELLRPGGVMLNKELHFTSSELMKVTRGMVFINKIFGETGSYRILHHELARLDEAGFFLEQIQQIHMSNYEATLSNWLSNMRKNRTPLEALVGADYYRQFATYLRMARFAFHDRRMTLDVVVSRSPA